MELNCAKTPLFCLSKAVKTIVLHAWFLGHGIYFLQVGLLIFSPRRTFCFISANRSEEISRGDEKNVRYGPSSKKNLLKVLNSLSFIKWPIWSLRRAKIGLFISIRACQTLKRFRFPRALWKIFWYSFSQSLHSGSLNLKRLRRY